MKITYEAECNGSRLIKGRVSDMGLVFQTAYGYTKSEVREKLMNSVNKRLETETRKCVQALRLLVNS